MLVAIFGCIQDLELDYVQPSCCRIFSAAKILPNPKLKKNFMPNFRYKYWDLGLLRVSVALSLPIP